MGQGYAESVPQTALEQLLGSIGKGTGAARGWLNEKAGIPGIDTGIGLGDMLMGQGPELLNEMSWGKSPFMPTGHGGKLDPRVGDVAGITGLAGMLKAPAKAVVKGGIDDLLRQAPRAQAEGGYIMGQKAKGANLSELQVAKDMKDMGASDADIFTETKWWLGHPDKKPRFEVTHGDEAYVSSNQLRDTMQDINRKSGLDMTPLQQAQMADAKNMFEGGITDYATRMEKSPYSTHYPEDAEITGFRSQFGTIGQRGSYSPDLKQIEITNRPDHFEDLMQSTAQHETQHAISDIEKFAPGGSPAGTMEFLLQKTKSERQKLLDKSKWDQLDKSELTKMKRLNEFQNMLKTADTNKAHQLYKQMADESQARLVQQRAHMTQAEMDADPFFKKYDVPLNKMIIKERY